jgi:hypothetical protein
MPDYQKGKIYKLYSPSKNLVYYGSTTQLLSQRLAGHKGAYKNFKNNNYHYVTAFKILECEDYKIELVEEYPCNNQQQLAKQEGEYIKANECINRCIAGRTEKEYNIDNADKIKQWKNDNADKTKEREKQWKNDNAHKIKEQQKQWRIKNANKIKQQYIDNVDKIKEYNKQYRLKKKLEQAEIE